MSIQVKNDMRLGDGGTEVGVFRYIGGSDGDGIKSPDLLYYNDRNTGGGDGD